MKIPYYKTYYQQNKKRIGLYKKKWWIKNKIARTAKDMGVSEKDIQDLLKKNKKCGICGKTKFGKGKHVDHNHKTGQLRGILCLSCNVGLGHFKDNINLLKKAIKYLKNT